MSGQNLAPARRPIPTLGGDSLRSELRELLLAQLRAIERGGWRLKVPRPQHLMQRNPGMHYHFRPELFLQMRGATRFRFPAEEMTLVPGDLGVLPTGLPHGEVALPADQPFRNMVVGFYSSSVSMHFAIETASGRPDIETIGFFPTPDLGRIIDLVEYLVRLYHSSSRQREQAVRGIALGLFSILADLTDAETPDLKHDSQRIFQIKWLVRDQLYNPELNVSFMAERLNCSADYLSHIFHKETGETLIHYIHRQRMAGAIETLANPALSVSEIAWACGFADAGYFTRVFRKHTGLTPLAYRRKREQEMARGDDQPKTIYHDRVDYSPGAALPATG